MNRKSKKSMTLNSAFNSKGDVGWLYLPRTKRERTSWMRNMYQK